MAYLVDSDHREEFRFHVRNFGDFVKSLRLENVTRIVEWIDAAPYWRSRRYLCSKARYVTQELKIPVDFNFGLEQHFKTKADGDHLVYMMSGCL